MKYLKKIKSGNVVYSQEFVESNKMFGKSQDPCGCWTIDVSKNAIKVSGEIVSASSLHVFLDALKDAKGEFAQRRSRNTILKGKI